MINIVPFMLVILFMLFMSISTVHVNRKRARALVGRWAEEHGYVVVDVRSRDWYALLVGFPLRCSVRLRDQQNNERYAILICGSMPFGLWRSKKVKVLELDDKPLKKPRGFLYPIFDGGWYDWRLVVSWILFDACGFVILTLMFPGGYWFDRFWAGGALGAVPAFTVAFWWRHRATRGKFRPTLMFLVCNFLLVGSLPVWALTIVVPNLSLEKRGTDLVRSLADREIMEVVMVCHTGEPIRIIKRGPLLSLRKLLRGARPWHPNHEVDREEFRLLRIIFPDGTFVEYTADVPTRHVDDISIDYGDWPRQQHILIPGMRKWVWESRGDAVDPAENYIGP
ncbi:MAG: hypothetical protein SVV80_04075 [Planctomycetota bacterium]|nr:hypothetical protein [Planctomycetota bacterium]